MMRMLIPLMIIMFCSSCAEKVNTSRHHYDDFEKQIGYTQVIRKGNHLYVSGIAAFGPGMKSQIESVYKQIKNILSDQGATMDDVVKELIFTTDMDELVKQAPVRKAQYSQGRYPTSSWVEVNRLYLPDFLIEVEIEAILD